MMDISLRRWELSDLDSLVEYANNKKIADNLTDTFPHPYTREAGIQFIEMTKSFDPAKIFAIDLEGKAIGSIGVFQQIDIMRKNAEMGYWLAEPYWGKGIAVQAIKLMTSYAFSNFDIDRIFARPFGRNVASQRVLEKSGFTYETRFEKTIIKNGVKEDELFYSIRI